ncbi:hypothetical protein [Streptomyces xinghaiensis]|uniref:hypothetical protein n=1 Tax=Streptomyces xinghaiensis TaxID=1038928 RepID=UPI0034351662
MQVEFALEELRTLASALVRLKFGEDEPSEPYFGSSMLAEAHRRIIESIIQESRQIGALGPAARWEDWQKWSSRIDEKRIVVRYASSLSEWGAWSGERKLEVLRTCTAPFVASDEELRDLCNQIDAARHSCR